MNKILSLVFAIGLAFGVMILLKSCSPKTCGDYGSIFIDCFNQKMSIVAKQECKPEDVMEIINSCQIEMIQKK